MEKLRIVIADDESIIRMDLRGMLEDAGHIVIAEATNGVELLEFVQTLSPDLVISDIKMPNMGGLDAAKIIAEKNPVPIILLTAFSQSEFVHTAADTGVLAYLVKPLKEEQLVPALEIAMSRFGNIQDLERKINKLQETLELRKLVEKAKGIIMNMHSFSEDVAYKKMQQYAMEKRSSLKAVACSVIQSYEKKQKVKSNE